MLSLDVAVPAPKHETHKLAKGKLGWENSSFPPGRAALTWHPVDSQRVCVRGCDTLIDTLTYFKQCRVVLGARSDDCQCLTHERRAGYE